MKTIFSGNVTITVEEVDGVFIATCWVPDAIESDPSNREYAAVADLFNKLRKIAIEKLEEK